MRLSDSVVLAAGEEWPEKVGGRSLPRFSWLRIANRGAAGGDVIFGLGGSVSADLQDYYDRVNAGTQAVYNFGSNDRNTEDREPDNLPSELHIRNIGGVATTVFFEVADHPIVVNKWSAT